MITIPAEALFDTLRDSKGAFQDENHQDWEIHISLRNSTRKAAYFEGDPELNMIGITKIGFMQLLLNRMFVCDEYELKIQL